MELQIILTIKLGDEWTLGWPEEEEEWFLNHVLSVENLSLHSNEIGDSIGEIINIPDKKVFKA